MLKVRTVFCPICGASPQGASVSVNGNLELVVDCPQCTLGIPIIVEDDGDQQRKEE